jgi:protocatechuate 3,4-dioxygenase beta subunit
MFLAFLRLVRKLWSPGGTLPAPRPRLAPAVEPLEDRWLPSTISGLVYFDANNDGIHQSTEPGIAGNTIQLYDSNGNLLATTSTDSTGRYTFATNPTVSPTAETQEVDATFAPARTNTTQAQSVAQFNPALGTLTGVEIINNGTLTSDLKVENDDSAAATITGNVNATLSLQAGGLTPVNSTAAISNSATLAATDGTDDFSGPSGRDFGSQSNNGTNDVLFSANSNDLSAFIGTGTVSLTESAQVTSSITGAGNLLAAVNSQASANVRIIYQYEAGAPLAPGDYTVVQPSDPAGYVHGLETADNVSPLPGSDQLNSIAVQLTNSDSLNNNFGERKLSSLSGTVYLDSNQNGVFDSGDQPLAGVTLDLSGTNDLGQQITGVQQTAADGSYAFSGLRAGNYTISEVQPAGYLSGTNSAGTLGGTVSGDSIAVTAPWSASGTGYNFGEVQQSTGPGSGTVTTPETPQPLSTLMTKRDFIGGAWTKWGW